MKQKITLFLLLFAHLISAQGENSNINEVNFGIPKEAISVSYKNSNQTYTLSGCHNLKVEKDEYNYLFNEIKGDFIITANFEIQETEKNTYQEIGLIIKGNLDHEATTIGAILSSDGSTFMKHAGTEGSFKITAPKFNYGILQLERSGNKFLMRAAHFGEPLQEIASQTIEMPETIQIGLFCSEKDVQEDTVGRVWNVRLDKPVPDDYNPGEEGYLGSRLETLNIRNGERKIIYTADKRFEAPNWMPDGKRLLFNMDGLIYTIPVKGGEIKQLNTGFADNNNNDHGISFDGKLLAISHHREGLPGGGSTIYVLPIEGGTPKLVTEETPSYWHGWAPNNREVVYVASRGDNPQYNIYKKSIEGGEEIALTDTGVNEHVDGPEYSPDGEYIYYNGSASGTMQIWRMKPDGSEKEQMTFDANNDWFPHISPDGRWIAYISFPEDIPVNDHPNYKRVTLNLIPTNGGAPKVLAYLYGGQGTINVPSWSPDSKFISFVSNF